MTLRTISFPWAEQPPETTDADRGNPLAAGLAHLWHTLNFPLLDAAGTANGAVGVGTGGTNGVYLESGRYGRHIRFTDAITGQSDSKRIAIGNSAGSGGPSGNTFTFFCLINPGSIAAFQTILGGGSGGVHIRLSTSGQIYLDRQADVNIGSSSSGIAAGVWSSIAVSYNGTTASYYINGQAAGTSSIAKTFSKQQYYIGGAASEFISNATLLIAPAIWDRVLSASEHATLPNDVWQLFAPRTQRVWTAASVSGAALTSDGSSLSSITAALTTAITLSASPSSTSAVSAVLTVGIALSASPSSASVVTAALTTGITLSASPSSASVVTAALTTGSPLAASPSSASTVTAALTTGIVLRASASSAAAVTAALTGGTTLSATPTNNSYSAASGTPKLGFGVTIYPDWRQGQVAGTWRQVSASKLSDVDPKFNAAYNPNGAGNSAPWSGSTGQAAVVDGWGGAVFDQVASKFWIPLGGGHSNYAGNEPYVQDMSVASPAWSMVRPPSGAVGNTITLNDGLESTGVYADGRIRSTHTYNNLAYVPGLGIVVYQMAVNYSSSTGSPYVFVINPVTGEATGPVATITNVGIGNTGFGNPGTPYIGCVHVPNRNRVYGLGNGSTVLLTYVNVGAPNATWSAGWVGSATSLMGAYGRPIYIPTLDKLLAITTGGSLALYNLDTGAASSPAVSGTAPSGFVFNGTTGGDWSPELGCVLMWNNTANTPTITMLTPDATGANWVIGTLTVSGSNTVTPSAMTANGTYGRFAYSQKLKGCFLLNSNAQPTYFFATE